MDSSSKNIITIGTTRSNINNLHDRYMSLALRQAKKAYALGEVPIGCIIVHNNIIIGRGYNKRNTCKDATAHAETIAIRQACRKLGDWRLDGCDMYVTLEPCQMCAGAIVQARVPRIIIGAMSEKAGSLGSIINILDNPSFNHRVEVISGIMEEECSSILKNFFEELRNKNKIAKDATNNLAIASLYPQE